METFDESTKSDRKIKEGFLHVLAHKRLDDITVIEVVREAHVSRSTFYLRFENLANVYDALVADMLKTTSPIEIQVGCSDCRQRAQDGGATPFCELVRNNPKYAPLIKEDRFLATVIRLIDPAVGGSIMREGMERGLSQQQAYALHVFQMSGCFAASVMSGTSDDEWPQVKHTIDEFIRGGIESFT